jgi:hypothetical protein
MLEKKQPVFKEILALLFMHNLARNMKIIHILYFTFLFVLVSAAGQYNVIWTGTGLPRFRFSSGAVSALLF